jgi:hypothetical protein
VSVPATHLPLLATQVRIVVMPCAVMPLGLGAPVSRSLAVSIRDAGHLFLAETSEFFRFSRGAILVARENRIRSVSRMLG